MPDGLFWSLTPIETQNWIDARTEGDLESAWRQAGMTRWKKLPSDPKELYKRSDGPQDPYEMKSNLQAMFRRSQNAGPAKKPTRS